jgi:hypothetical protein
MKSNPKASPEHILSGRQRAWVLGIVGAILLLAGSVFGVDWINYFHQTGSLYPAIGKPVITLMAMILVLNTGKYALGSRDWWLLWALSGYRWSKK